MRIPAPRRSDPAGSATAQWKAYAPPRLIVVPAAKILSRFLGFGLATEARCSFPGFSTVQTFVTTFVGAGVPPLRMSVPGTPMPSRSGSSGGMRLVPETNSQKLSVSGLYYKAFAGAKPAPPQRSFFMPDAAVTTVEPAWAAFVALDWGSQKHAWILEPARRRQAGRGFRRQYPGVGRGLGRWSEPPLRRPAGRRCP